MNRWWPVSYTHLPRREWAVSGKSLLAGSLVVIAVLFALLLWSILGRDSGQQVDVYKRQKVGIPNVEGASVEAKVVKNGKGKKLNIITCLLYTSRCV